jgi:FAD binding domain
MLDQTALAEFKTSLAGELIQPGEKGYDEARQVYNGMIDRRPRLIARCADAADVIAAVNFGRKNRMLIAVRGGGHNAGGLGICDDGLVIDLSLINYTRVDPPIGQCVWGAVARGMLSTTPRMLLVWPCPQASFRPPELVD